MISYPKIMILSDGTPETTRVFVNGQQVAYDNCYFSSYSNVTPDKPATPSDISFNITVSNHNNEGESVSTTYRLFKTAKGELKFQKLVTA